jgi:two-component system chemotaxis sensor kinase CheA
MSEQNPYLQAFLGEAEDLIVQIEERCLVLQDDPSDLDTVNAVFRSVHTLKGSGAMFGLEDVAAFAHHVEALLDAMRNGIVIPDSKNIRLIFQSKDQIDLMLKNHRGASHTVHTEYLIEQLEELIPKKASVNQAIVATEQSEVALATTQKSLYKIRFIPEPEMFKSGTDPASILEELRDLGEIEISHIFKNGPLNSQAEAAFDFSTFDPESCYLGWELLLKTSSSQNDIQDVFIFVEHNSEIKIDEIPFGLDASEEPKIGEILVQEGLVSKDQLNDALDNRQKIGDYLTQKGIVKNQDVDAALGVQKAMKKLKDPAVLDETIKVSSLKLNQLINLVGELVIARAGLTDVALKINNAELTQKSEVIETLISDLREGMLNIRMVPIGTAFGRFKRLVSDLSHDLGKKINLELCGEETELDKTVVDKLAEPLVHMIRNSADHGLESEAERLANNKPAEGTIRLIAQHKGGTVDIHIEDDGRGLNKEAIVNRAIQKGLISEDHNLSDEDIYLLIFAAGFSTAEVVTSVSGRGVGMDVVKKEIEALKGKIRIHSTPGKGARFTLTLPLSMSIIDGLMVQVDSQRYVLPINTVQECEELYRLEYSENHGRKMLFHRNQMISFIRLKNLFSGQPNHSTDIQNAKEELVVLQTNQGVIGVVVDKVLGDHQTVVKSLGKFYESHHFVSGSTILGDGTVALILDPEGLYSEIQRGEA